MYRAVECGILQQCRVAELVCEHVEVVWGCLFFSDSLACLGVTVGSGCC